MNEVKESASSKGVEGRLYIKKGMSKGIPSSYPSSRIIHQHFPNQVHEFCIQRSSRCYQLLIKETQVSAPSLVECFLFVLYIDGLHVTDILTALVSSFGIRVS